MNKRLEREIRVTYADCQPGNNQKCAQHVRRLDWRADESVSGEDVRTALLAACEGYNNFDSESVANAILAVDPNAKVYVAREGSVCLYISTEYPTKLKRNKTMKSADEIDTEDDGTIRFWWD